LFKQILSFLLGSFIERLAMQQFRKRAVLIYLKTLQAMRRSLLISFGVFIAVQMMVIGLFGAIITLIWLCPDIEPRTRLWILLGFFAFSFIVPLVSLFLVFSEKLWYKLSGAEEMLND
jgi:hypothetical protein